MHNDGEFTAEVLEWYQKTLASFDGKKKIKSNTAADVICPGHDDTNPSLGVDLKENNGSGPGYSSTAVHITVITRPS
jgi:hypothetical protein